MHTPRISFLFHPKKRARWPQGRPNTPGIRPCSSRLSPGSWDGTANRCEAKGGGRRGRGERGGGGDVSLAGESQPSSWNTRPLEYLRLKRKLHRRAASWLLKQANRNCLEQVVKDQAVSQSEISQFCWFFKGTKLYNGGRQQPILERTQRKAIPVKIVFLQTMRGNGNRASGRREDDE